LLASSSSLVIPLLSEGMTTRDGVEAKAAGVFDGLVALHEMPDDKWERVLGVDLTASMQLCGAVLPHLRAVGGGGAIVNVASIAALGSSGGAAYTVSKHGLLALSESIAWMYRDGGIRCNIICPGFVAGPKVGDLYGSYHHHVGRSQIAGGSACGIARATGDQRGHFGALPGPCRYPTDQLAFLLLQRQRHRLDPVLASIHMQ
jgi:NAD(P)-dependent dehydrogenase (short-subunit alcohol dehydrogenase family)